jgi:hypothetical protein
MLSLPRSVKSRCRRSVQRLNRRSSRGGLNAFPRLHFVKGQGMPTLLEADLPPPQHLLALAALRHSRQA